MPKAENRNKPRPGGDRRISLEYSQPLGMKTESKQPHSATNRRRQTRLKLDKERENTSGQEKRTNPNWPPEEVFGDSPGKRESRRDEKDR